MNIDLVCEARILRNLSSRLRNDAHELTRCIEHSPEFHALYGQLVDAAGHADDMAAELELELVNAG